MTTHQDRGASVSAPPPLGFHWSSLPWWLPLCMLQGLAVAWGACRVQVDLGFAPLVLFPVLVGLLLGVTGVGLLRLLQMGSRPVAVIGTLLAASVAAFGQHYFLYREHFRRLEEKLDQVQQPGTLPRLGDVLEGHLPRPGFVEYLQSRAQHGRPLLGDRSARGVWAWLSWAMDAVITLAATLAVVVPALKQPYCPTCRTWFQTVRNDRVDESTGRRIAELAGLVAPVAAATARCRLFGCLGNCGPTGIELSWPGTRARGAWIDRPTRERVTDLLDHASQPMKDG